MIFELQYKDVIEKSDDIGALRKRAMTLNCPWQIFKIIQSKVNIEIEELNIFGEDGIEGIARKISKGATRTEMAKQCHISSPTLSKYLAKFEKEYKGQR